MAYRWAGCGDIYIYLKYGTPLLFQKYLNSYLNLNLMKSYLFLPIRETGTLCHARSCSECKHTWRNELDSIFFPIMSAQAHIHISWPIHLIQSILFEHYFYHKCISSEATWWNHETKSKSSSMFTRRLCCLIAIGELYVLHTDVTAGVTRAAVEIHGFLCCRGSSYTYILHLAYPYMRTLKEYRS